MVSDEMLVPRVAAGDVQDQRSFRDNLGRFPTGVVLITANTPAGPVGMAVNSFASVSLDPPLISFCPMVTSETWASIRAVGSFSISILRSTHESVSRLFAQRGVDRFGEHAWAHSPAGHPVLVDALGWIDASVSHVQRAGDHDLVIADAVAWSEVRDGEPLVFFGGRYGTLSVA